MPQESLPDILVEGVPGFDAPISFPGDMSREEISKAIAGLPEVRRAGLQEKMDKVRGAQKALTDLGVGSAKLFEGAVRMVSVQGWKENVTAWGNYGRGFATDLMTGAADPGQALYNLGTGKAPFNMEQTANALGLKPVDDSQLSTVQKGLADIASSVPEIAASVVYPAGAPYFFAGGAGLKTAAEMDNRPDLDPLDKVSRVATQTMAAGMAPALGKMGTEWVGGFMRSWINAGSQLATKQGAQRLAESVGANILQQPLEFLASAPDFIEASPDERKEMAVRMLVGNVAFAVPELLSRAQTATKAGMSQGENLAASLSEFIGKVDPELAWVGPETTVDIGQADYSQSGYEVIDNSGVGAVAELAGGVRQAVNNPDFREAWLGQVEMMADQAKKPGTLGQASIFGKPIPPKGPDIGMIDVYGFGGEVRRVPGPQGIEFPEAVAILDQLDHAYKAVHYREGRRLGAFYYRGISGKEPPLVTVHKQLAENPQAALHTFLHEIGHAHEFYGYGAMAQQINAAGQRNMINRIGQLNEYMLEQLPGKPGVKGSEVNNAEILQEVSDWSFYWRPADPYSMQDPKFFAYRTNAKELYADFVGGMLMRPELVRQKAPQAFQTWLNWMEAKPEFKAAYDDVQSALRGKNHETRIGNLKDSFRQGRQKIREVAAIAKDFALQGPDKFWIKTDASHYIRRRVEESQSPLWDNPVRRLDEAFFQDAQTFQFVADLNNKIIDPILTAGGDVDDFGTYLFLTRVKGNPEAWQRFKSIKSHLGEAALADMQKLAARYERWQRRKDASDPNDLSEQKKLQKVLDKIEAALKKAFNGDYGLSDLDSFYFDNRLKGTRADIFNRAGYNPETASKLLDDWMAEMSPELRDALVHGSDYFRREVYQIVESAYDAGLLTDRAIEIVRDNRDWYATFRNIEYINRTYLSPLVKRSTGSINKIENPMYSTVFKMVPTLQAIAEQRAKNAAREFFVKDHPNEFVKQGKRTNTAELRAKGLEPLNIYEKGVKKTYWVSEGIGEAFRNLSSADIVFGVNWLSKIYRNTIYPMIISYNPAFALANPIRDVRRAWLNLPAITSKYDAGSSKGIRRRFMREYLGSIKTAYNYYKGQIDPDVESMLNAFAIASPLSGLYTMRGHSTVDSILFGMAGEAPPGDVRGGVLKFLEDKAGLKGISKLNAPVWMDRVGNLNPFKWVRVFGAISEVMPKIAAYRLLSERVPPQEVAHIVREYIGTPNYRRRGQWTSVLNAVRPFSNIALQGYASDAKLAFNKKSAASWWLSYAVTQGPYMMLAAAAMSGLLGEELEEWADHVGLYDWMNYDLIPIGMIETGNVSGRKSGMIRIPRDESTRWVTGAIMMTIRDRINAWKASEEGQRYKSQWVSQSAQHVTALAPSESNILEMLAAGVAWMTGKQHEDSFTGRGVFSDDAMLLGKGYTLAELAKYLKDKSGFSNLFPWDPVANMEKEAVEMVPGLMRFVKFTDQGQREKQSMQERIDRSDRAWVRQGFDPKVLAIRRRFYGLQRLGQSDRTPTQEVQYLFLGMFVKEIDRVVEEVASGIESNPSLLKDKEFKAQIREFQDKFGGLVPVMEEMLDKLPR